MRSALIMDSHVNYNALYCVIRRTHDPLLGTSPSEVNEFAHIDLRSHPLIDSRRLTGNMCSPNSHSKAELVISPCGPAMLAYICVKNMQDSGSSLS
jgi:hypothetical protein